MNEERKMTVMRVAAAIEASLRRAFAPVRLSIVDESHKHAGHAGARPEGESHFRVEIVSALFEGKSRIERQRMVYAALAEPMKTDIHALALKTLAPTEDKTP
jgi:BolA protein